MNQHETLRSKVGRKAKELLAKYPSFRKGQALMNALYAVDPELYDRVTDTEADCFSDDRNINNFWARIKQG